jgi:hypothetical protein
MPEGARKPRRRRIGLREYLAYRGKIRLFCGAASGVIPLQVSMSNMKPLFIGNTIG